MKTNKNLLNAAFLAVLSLLVLPRLAAAQQMKTLPDHLPAAIARFNLRPIGQLSPGTNLTLAISLPPQNEQALDALLSQMYDPGSTNYHHFLKPGEFSARFGPSADDYQKVIDFARSNGLSVVCSYSNRALLDVNGKVSDIEKAFQVTLRTYHHPIENRDFYAPSANPTIRGDLPISHVSGLDDYVIPHPLLKIQPLNNLNAGAHPNLGSAPSGQYMGQDFRAAYVPGVALNGAGQSIALFELDGYFTADILSYEQQAGLPSVTLTNISVDGGVPNPTPYGDPEVSLDIEMVISMATNASKVIVYEAPNGAINSPLDELNRIAQDDLAAQISSSWGIGDNPAYDIYYVQMALQGQSFFQASGDEGAYYPGTYEWADDTNITLVGGTTLSTTRPGGAWSSETVWNWWVEYGFDGGSGGGTNINSVPIPSWQQGVSMTNNMGSTTLRNVPDVALTADNIYIIFENGQTTAGSYSGGTSCAAPLWAGFTALVNQQAIANGKSTVGFLNPAIYTIGESANYTNCFHDITTGNNTNSVVSNAYFAVPGYDLATGWGTPNGSNLINALTTVATTNVTYTHISAPPPRYGSQMANLNGGNPNGNWYLFVQDDQVINSGLISNGWSVALTTANPIGYVADTYLAMTASATNLAVVGTPVTFYLGVTNYGPNLSSNVVVQDSLPFGFAFVSSNATLGSVAISGQTLQWNVGNLTNGVGARLNLTLQANVVGTAINAAQVSASTPNQNPADGFAQVIVNVGASSAPSVASAAVGFGGKFHLTISGGASPIIIQASTNLMTWVNIWTNYTAPFTFTDSVSSGMKYRFYRAEVP